MIKNYASLSLNTTLKFNQNSDKKNATVVGYRPMTTSWFFMILMLLGTTINHEALAKSKTAVVCTSSYTYHTLILKSFIAHGHSRGGGHGYAFCSPTDHDKPIWSKKHDVYNSNINSNYNYNINSNTSTNNKTYQS